MSKTGRGTDPLDHLRLQCSEGNVVATSVAKAAIEFVQARIAELDRKATAFDLIAGRHVTVQPNPASWCVWHLPGAPVFAQTLLEAVEIAATALESSEGTPQLAQPAKRAEAIASESIRQAKEKFGPAFSPPSDLFGGAQ